MIRGVRKFLITRNLRDICVVIFTALASAVCGCTHGTAVRAKDAGATSQDVASATDGAADPNPEDASRADSNPTLLGGDDVSPDVTVARNDAGSDGSILPTDTPTAKRDHGGGEPLACQGNLPLGNYLPSTSGGSIAGPLALGDLDGDGKVDLVSYGGVLLGKGNGAFSDPLAFVERADAWWSALALGDLRC